MSSRSLIFFSTTSYRLLFLTHTLQFHLYKFKLIYLFVSSLTTIQFSSVQSLSRVRLFATPWTAAHQASLSNTNSWSLLKTCHWVGDAIQPSYPLSSPSLLPSTFFSTRVFSSESVLCIRWPKYWSFNFSISPFNDYSGLISFRIDRLDLLAAQGTLKSLLQHHSSKASVLWCSAL